MSNIFIKERLLIMKNVVSNKKEQNKRERLYKMEDTVLEKVFCERIKENKKVFTEDEINIIKANKNLAKKLYIIGVTEGKYIYEY